MAKGSCAPKLGKGGGGGSLTKGAKGGKGGFVSTPASFTKKK
jgi:hypothetical protein